MRELIIADNVHGESGLDGPALPEPGFTPQNCTAVELMAKVLRESAEPVTLVATGPQTNVALLLNSHPELHSKIARIVIMGGAMGWETGRLRRSSTSLSTRKPRKLSSSRACRL
jgi:pyrimidine-specific ribonucleoside hydrolase